MSKTLEALLEKIKITEIEDSQIEQQKIKIAEKLGLNPDDIEVKLDVTATQMAREGVLVDLHIGRSRFELRLSPDDLGLNERESEYKEFLTEYINLGRKRLIPQSILKKLNSLEARARNMLKEKYAFKTTWGYFVPYKVYDELMDELNAIKTEYYETYQEIIDRYESIRFSTLIKYQEAAPEVYRTLKKDPAAEPPDEFIEKFTGQVMKHFPSKTEIENSYRFDVKVSFIPLTYTMKEAEARMELVSSKLKMQKDVAEKMKKDIQESYKKEVKDFVEGLVVQLRSMIYEVVEKARDSLNNHGSLPGPSVKSLKTMIEKIERLNFMEDKEVIKYIEELNKIIKTDAKDRSHTDISNVLSKIAEENRQLLLSLGHEPRRTRNKVITGKNNENQGPVKRRTRRSSNITGQVNDNNDNDVVAKRRQRTSSITLFNLINEEVS